MISWSDHVDISCSFEQAWQAVADQHRVMNWSAWPQATGYTCSVEGDGISPGSAIVFRSPDGQEMGRQTIISVEAAALRNRLANRGPAGRTVEPEVDFRVEQLAPGLCRVWLDFRLQPPVPAVLLPLVRLVLRWKIRPMHRKDLDNLKREVELQAA